jgi:hypothetical protein
MGGTAPANQLRLSFTGSEDGEAETETCRAAKLLVANDDSNLRPVRAQLAEPPYADPPVRWCGRGEQVTAPPIAIRLNFGTGHEDQTREFYTGFAENTDNTEKKRTKTDPSLREG